MFVEMLVPLLYILAGFLLLYYGGDWLVIGAVRLAVKFNISPVLVALTVVAFGTSLPELLVSGLSAYTGHCAVAVGNILGSDICNICLVAGICAVISNPMKGDKSVASRDTFMLVISTALFGFLARDLLFTFNDGIIMTLVFLTYMSYVIYSESKGRKPRDEKADPIDKSDNEDPLEEFLDEKDTHLYRYILAGLIMLPIGAHVLVVGGIELARIFGISERFISMTIVSWGTSLPEFATSVAAAMHGHSAMCVGNVVGSNIFNTLVIAGATSLFIPIKVSLVAFKVDFILVCVATLLFAFIHRRGKDISRIEGAILGAGFLVMLYLLK